MPFTTNDLGGSFAPTTSAGTRGFSTCTAFGSAPIATTEAIVESTAPTSKARVVCRIVIPGCVPLPRTPVVLAPPGPDRVRSPFEPGGASTPGVSRSARTCARGLSGSGLLQHLVDRRLQLFLGVQANHHLFHDAGLVDDHGLGDAVGAVGATGVAGAVEQDGETQVGFLHEGGDGGLVFFEVDGEDLEGFVFSGLRDLVEDR